MSMPESGPQPPSPYAGLPAMTPEEPREDPAKAQLREFDQTLRTLTPHVVVTYLFVAVNLTVFALMAASGVGLVTPTTEGLLRWGANFGPLTLKGEWWRLLTSTFVHIGIVHLAVNMWALFDLGSLVERMFGNVGFAILYVLSGLCGSLASLYWNRETFSAGASGAIFGMFGALLAFMLLRRDSIPAAALAEHRNSAAAFVILNLMIGYFFPRIDNAAHLGGFVGGFLSGLILCHPLTPDGQRQRPLRNLLLLVVGSVLFTAGAKLVPTEGIDYVLAKEHFLTTEKKVIDAYNGAVERLNKKEITAQDLTVMVERDALPPWREARARLDAVTDAGARYRRELELLREYCKLREESWALFVEGVREQNWAKDAESKKKGDEAEAKLKQLNELNK